MPTARIMLAVMVALLPTAGVATQPDCRLAEAARDVAVEVRRFRTPGVRSELEDTARLLVPSPCETSPAPRLTLRTVDLGLALEDWRQGTRELERARLNR